MSLSGAGPDHGSLLLPCTSATPKPGGANCPSAMFLAFPTGSSSLEPPCHLVLHKPCQDRGNAELCCGRSPDMGRALLSWGGWGCSEHGHQPPRELRPHAGTSKGANPLPKQHTLRAAPQNKQGFQEGQAALPRGDLKKEGNDISHCFAIIWAVFLLLQAILLGRKLRCCTQQWGVTEPLRASCTPWGLGVRRVGGGVC